MPWNFFTWEFGQEIMKDPGRLKHEYSTVKSSVKVCHLQRFKRYLGKWCDLSPQTEKYGNSAFFPLKFNLVRIPSHCFGHNGRKFNLINSGFFFALGAHYMLYIIKMTSGLWSPAHSNSYLSHNATISWERTLRNK